MHNQWKKQEATQLEKQLQHHGKDLAHCIYASRLLGKERDLVLHGGGNSSVKSEKQDLFGNPQSLLFVKASGFDLEEIQPVAFPALDLDRMRRFQNVTDLSQEEMLRQMRLSMLNPDDPVPSVEGFLHAFIPSKYVFHTHPTFLLALTNQPDGEAAVKKVLENNISIVPYIRAGFGLALQAGKSFQAQPDAEGMVLLQHGLVTWGETAEEAYSATIRIVTKAEEYWSKLQTSAPRSHSASSTEEAWQRYTSIAPVVRGMFAEKTDNKDQPFRRFILSPCITEEVLEFLERQGAKKIALSAPLTPDHLIRTKAFPLFIETPDYADLDKLKQQLESAFEEYRIEYEAYFKRHTHRLEGAAPRVDSKPRVILLPGIGAICAGIDEKSAIIARDITQQSITVKRTFTSTGHEYRGIEEEHLFEMEYLLMQQAKIARREPPLQRQVALITGAAGAIGTGITEAFLENGCHVAVTDLPGEMLDRTAENFRKRYEHQVLPVAMDVTDQNSVENAFQEVVRRWGGIDVVVVNAGVAMVSALAEMDVSRFRRLEQVNVDGTLIVLRESARLFQKQATGGDIVLISTKNVFAPGAKFGAYSATKAAAHQLARIASLEFADFGVRVNMVAPDAVFSHAGTKSGLWSEVGPDRMKARGLDEAGLEDYYRNRNLLKTAVTAEHVARAVLFFVTRQTPTTGATIPVDGGLPDATPR